MYASLAGETLMELFRYRTYQPYLFLPANLLRDILGASVLSVGLAHAIARGVFAGLVKRRGEFVRTPKGWKDKGTLAFFSPLREEIGLLLALVLGAVVLVLQRGYDDIEVQLWVGILALQCVPYVASIACQVASYMPEAEPAKPLEAGREGTAGQAG